MVQFEGLTRCFGTGQVNTKMKHRCWLKALDSKILGPGKMFKHSYTYGVTIILRLSEILESLVGGVFDYGLILFSESIFHGLVLKRSKKKSPALDLKSGLWNTRWLYICMYQQ